MSNSGITDIKLVGTIAVFDRWEEMSDIGFEQLVADNKIHRALLEQQLEPKEFTQFFSTLLRDKQDIYEWYRALNNINYLGLKLIFEGVRPLLTDFSNAILLTPASEIHQTLEQIRSALERIEFILEKFPSQFPEQLIKAFNNSLITNKSLSDQIDKWKTYKSSVFLCPLVVETFGLRSLRIRVFSKHIGLISKVIYSPDENYLLSADKGSIQVWGTLQGTLSGEHSLENWSNKNNSDVTSITFSNDGQYLVTTFRETEFTVMQVVEDADQRIQLIEKYQLPCSSAKTVMNSHWLSGDKFMLVSTSGILEFWDARKGELIDSFDTGRESIHALAVFSDNTRVVVGGGATFGDPQKRTIQIWNISEKKILFESGVHEWPIDNVLISIDEKLIISTANESIYRWDISGETEVQKRKFGLKISALALHPSGEFFAIGIGDFFKILKVGSLEEVASIGGHHARISSLLFNSAGEHLISSSWDQTIVTWDFRKLLKLGSPLAHTESIESIAVSSDKKYLLTASRDKSILVWNLPERKAVSRLSYHEHWVKGLSNPSVAGWFYSASWDGTVRKGNIFSGENITIFSDADKHLESLAVSSDQKLIISGAFDAEPIVIKGETDDIAFLTLDFKGGEIVKYSANEQEIIMVDRTGLLRFLDVNAFEVLKTYRHCADLEEEKMLDSHTHEEIDLIKRIVNGVCAFDVINDDSVIVATKDGFIRQLFFKEQHIEEQIIGSISCQITALHYLAKYDLLVTCSGEPHYASDNTLRIWNLDNNQIVAQFVLDVPLTACLCLEEEKLVIVGDTSGQLHFFQIANLS